MNRSSSARSMRVVRPNFEKRIFPWAFQLYRVFVVTFSASATVFSVKYSGMALFSFPPLWGLVSVCVVWRKYVPLYKREASTSFYQSSF